MIDGRKKVVIAGAGGMGSAVALLLRELGEGFDIYIGDAKANVAQNVAEWINNGSNRSGIIEHFEMPLDGSNQTLDRIVSDGHIVLDCLPGEQAPRIARIAREKGLHYANLTEYVQETKQIMDLADGTDRGFILQTGVAPGFINVLAMQLFNKFCGEHGVDRVDSISMKVGALTKNAIAPHYYGYTWSPIGVATEYIEPANVIRNGRKTQIPSLSERSNVIIDGVTYEEAITSGGTADLPDALQGRVQTLDYKTLRHSGHYKWVEGLVRDILPTLPEGLSPEQRNKQLAERLDGEMQRIVPNVEDDMIVIYASAIGKDSEGKLRMLERAYVIEPMKIGGKTLRAIQATTAAALAESAQLLLTGNYSGVLLQSAIDPEKFMKGPFVSKIYNNRGN